MRREFNNDPSRPKDCVEMLQVLAMVEDIRDFKEGISDRRGVQEDIEALAEWIRQHPRARMLINNSLGMPGRDNANTWDVVP